MLMKIIIIINVRRITSPDIEGSIVSTLPLLMSL